MTKKMMIIQEIKKAIRTEKALTCVDLDRIFMKHGIERGNLVWHHPTSPSNIYWTGLSPEGLDVLRSLMQDGEIRIYRESAQSYLCQGARLNLSSKTKDNYIWCPVGFAMREPVLSAV